jgi:hypothetical protein
MTLLEYALQLVDEKIAEVRAVEAQLLHQKQLLLDEAHAYAVAQCMRALAEEYERDGLVH